MCAGFVHINKSKIERNTQECFDKIIMYLPNQPQGWKHQNITSRKGQLGLVTGATRRLVSICVVGAKQVCLVERLAFLRPGARAAAQHQ